LLFMKGCRRLKTQENANGTLADLARAACPTLADQFLAECRHIPAKFVLRQARARIDLVQMLLRLGQNMQLIRNEAFGSGLDFASPTLGSPSASRCRFRLVAFRLGAATRGGRRCASV
jgi:hypothetical protein